VHFAELVSQNGKRPDSYPGQDKRAYRHPNSGVCGSPYRILGGGFIFMLGFALLKLSFM
jgi:hypothetical protein